jgi:hypothetical protein
MPRLTIAFGVVLILLGVGFYLGTGRQSVTALIPAFLGAPILACGAWALSDRWRKTAMHVALVLALLGLGGTVSGAIKLVKQAMGEEIARPEAALAQGIVAVLCLVFLVLGIRSFVVARRRQRGES